ncbi:MAG: glycosyltransferase family 2 protein [Elusimicrobia bacterium]|nr:glycosyltransferase family 2 protein [Elusimicrobiota bacterium]
MHKNLKISVVIPAYNENDLITETLEGVPEFVDSIFVINDGSTDDTASRIKQRQRVDSRIILIHHEANKGLGQSLIDGYLASAKSDGDVTAIMAGDNQMHPSDLPKMIDALLATQADYIKGNRLLHRNIDSMPTYRFFGNAILTILTKFATGYYSIMDPQCGYTLIRNSALRNIPIERMTRGYGYNADILCMLNIEGFRATDIEVQPVYGREKSKIKLWKYIPKTSLLLIHLFFRRLWGKYVVRDFHPLVLFYAFAFINIVFIIIPMTVRFFYYFYLYGEAPKTTLLILTSSLMTTIQTILFALWMDMHHGQKP